MKRLMMSAFAAVALLVMATMVLGSQVPATSGHFAPASTISVQQLHSATEVNKLPTEDFEDQSLVYSTTAKH